MEREQVLLNHHYYFPWSAVFFGALWLLIRHFFTAFEWFGLRNAIVYRQWLVVKGRKAQTVEVVKRNHHTMWVRLSDGHVVKRRLRRDLTPVLVD